MVSTILCNHCVGFEMYEFNITLNFHNGLYDQCSKNSRTSVKETENDNIEGLQLYQKGSPTHIFSCEYCKFLGIAVFKGFRTIPPGQLSSEQLPPRKFSPRSITPQTIPN